MIDHFGHAITPERLHIATETIDAVRDSRYPTITSGSRLLLTPCSAYPLFVPNFLQILVPLNRRLKKGESATIELIVEEWQTLGDLVKYY